MRSIFPRVLALFIFVINNTESRTLDENNNIAGDDAVTTNSNYAFLSDFALKYEGCYTVPQFYPYGQGQNQKNKQQMLGLYAQQVVKYKLCAGDAASLKSTCVGPEYVTDLSSFVNAYTEAMMTQDLYFCEKLREEADATGGCATASDITTCEHAYFNKTGYSSCIQSDQETNFYVQKYLYCQQYKINNVAYYIGPVCTTDGTGIVLKLFTDRYCSTEDTTGVFYAAHGYNLPFSDSSRKNLASSNFYNCVGRQYYSNNMCTNLYPISAKCEKGMSAVIASPSTDSCGYIQSVAEIQMNQAPMATSYTTAKVLAWIFFLSSVALGFYCYKLRKRIKPRMILYEDGDFT
jgi:hypothetical protein